MIDWLARNWVAVGLAVVIVAGTCGVIEQGRRDRRAYKRHGER